MTEVVQPRELPRGVLDDAIYLLCGDKLGEGVDRQVFAYKLEPQKYVIKLETGTSRFQNVMEYRTWKTASPHARRWLADVWAIGPYGSALIMRRTIPLRIKELPRRMPEWLSDLKMENYGILDGRVVCHDYGTNLSINHGSFSKKSRRLTEKDWAV